MRGFGAQSLTPPLIGALLSFLGEFDLDSVTQGLGIAASNQAPNSNRAGHHDPKSRRLKSHGAVRQQNLLLLESTPESTTTVSMDAGADSHHDHHSKILEEEDVALLSIEAICSPLMMYDWVLAASSTTQGAQQQSHAVDGTTQITTDNDNGGTNTTQPNEKFPSLQHNVIMGTLSCEASLFVTLFDEFDHQGGQASEKGTNDAASKYYHGTLEITNLSCQDETMIFFTVQSSSRFQNALEPKSRSRGVEYVLQLDQCSLRPFVYNTQSKGDTVYQQQRPLNEPSEGKKGAPSNAAAVPAIHPAFSSSLPQTWIWSRASKHIGEGGASSSSPEHPDDELHMLPLALPLAYVHPQMEQLRSRVGCFIRQHGFSQAFVIGVGVLAIITAVIHVVVARRMLYYMNETNAELSAVSKTASSSVASKKALLTEYDTYDIIRLKIVLLSRWKSNWLVLLRASVNAVGPTVEGLVLLQLIHLALCQLTVHTASIYPVLATPIVDAIKLLFGQGFISKLSLNIWCYDSRDAGGLRAQDIAILLCSSTKRHSKSKEDSAMAVLVERSNDTKPEYTTQDNSEAWAGEGEGAQHGLAYQVKSVGDLVFKEEEEREEVECEVFNNRDHNNGGGGGIELPLPAESEEEADQNVNAQIEKVKRIDGCAFVPPIAASSRPSSFENGEKQKDQAEASVAEEEKKEEQESIDPRARAAPNSFIAEILAKSDKICKRKNPLPAGLVTSSPPTKTSQRRLPLSREIRSSKNVILRHAITRTVVRSRTQDLEQKFREGAAGLATTAGSTKGASISSNASASNLTTPLGIRSLEKAKPLVTSDFSSLPPALQQSQKNTEASNKHSRSVTSPIPAMALTPVSPDDSKESRSLDGTGAHYDERLSFLNDYWEE